jgi:ribosomal protein L15
MNVGELDRIADRLLSQNLAHKEDDGIHIDLKSLGVHKLLGAGKVTSPFVLKVESHSESALQKIEGASGRVISEES